MGLLCVPGKSWLTMLNNTKFLRNTSKLTKLKKIKIHLKMKKNGKIKFTKPQDLTAEDGVTFVK